MALPQQAISLFAVKTALGTSESSVISLCKSNKINKWSAVKPFRHANALFTSAQLASALQSSNFGLSPTPYNNASNALDAIRAGVDTWPYTKPPGTSAYPCRLGDFRGYNHAAPVPYSTLVTFSHIVQGQNNGDFEIEIHRNSSAEILVQQMPIFSGGTWVLLYRPQGGNVTAVNGPAVSSSFYSHLMAVQGLGTAGLYHCCMAIYINGFYYPVPNTYKTFTLEVLPPQFTLLWNNCMWNQDKTVISFEIAIRNNRATGITLNPLTITLREVAPGGDPTTGDQPPGSSPYSFITNSMTIPGDSTVIVKSGQFINITYNPSKHYFVGLQSSSGNQIPYEYQMPEDYTQP